MELTNLDNGSASSPFYLVEILLVLIILNSVIILQDFYSGFRFILFQLYKQIISHISFVFPAWKRCSKEASAEALIDEDIEREKLVMSVEGVKIAIEELVSRLEEIDLDGVFEEEPSLEEVKEAFGVFDENDDGFIDATELRNVLCRLGFREASEAECGRMISAFDDDQDGRIDFNEFVKLLDRSFSS